MNAMTRPRISALRLQEVARYDWETGIFTNMMDRGKKAKAGQPFGCLGKQGYLDAKIDNRTYRLHQLAFLYMWGYWPDGVMDHINGDKTDNRWCNLRHVNHAINNQNKRKAMSNNKLGILGVCQVTGGTNFVARIKYGGKNRCLGEFKTPQEAQAAYLAAKRQHHEGNTL